MDSRRTKIARRNRLFDPEHHVIPGSSLIIPEIMIQTDLDYLP
jgi:hypothetical protein